MIYLTSVKNLINIYYF